MSIAESTLAGWSHHEAGTAFKQAHVPIRKAMQEHKGLSQFTYEVFLQGSYKNDTNLGGDSDVDVVIRLASKLKPSVVALTGERLQKDGSHRFAMALEGEPASHPVGRETPARDERSLTRLYSSITPPSPSGSRRAAR